MESAEKERYPWVAILIAVLTLVFVGFLIGRKPSTSITTSPSPAATTTISISSHLPSFTIDGRFVHPLCLDNFPYQATTTVSLTNCSELYRAVPYATDTAGWITADRVGGDGYVPGEDEGDDSYKILGTYGADTFISLVTNGGGTGTFTYIYPVILTGDTLRIASTTIFNGGDRAFGGINNATANGPLVDYALGLNEVGLMDLATGSSTASYDSLDGSAIGTVAFAQYQYDLRNNTNVFQGVELGLQWGVYATSSNKLEDDPDNSTNPAYAGQKCFNHLYNSYIQTGKATLSPAALSQFGQQFLTGCAGK